MSVYVRNRNHEICRYICHAKGHVRYISKFQIRTVFGQTTLNTESRFFGPSSSVWAKHVLSTFYSIHRTKLPNLTNKKK